MTHWVRGMSSWYRADSSSLWDIYKSPMQWDVTEFVACSLLIDMITHVSYRVIEFVVFRWLIEFVTYIWVTHVMPCDVHTLVPFNYSEGRHDSLSSWHMHASLITCHTMWLSSWDIAHSSSSWNTNELLTTCHSHTMCNACPRRLLHRQTWLLEFVVFSWLTDFVVVSWLTEFVTHAWVTHN